jgi:hypothetical protein
MTYIITQGVNGYDSCNKEFTEYVPAWSKFASHIGASDYANANVSEFTNEALKSLYNDWLKSNYNANHL